MTEDRTVPRDEVWFDITCSEAFGETELGPTEEYQHTGNGTWKEAVVNVCQHGSMGFEEQMRMAVSVRDQFLEELKEGKFSHVRFPLLQRDPRSGSILIITRNWSSGRSD